MGKKRTVYFFTGAEVMGEEEPVVWAGDKWDEFLDDLNASSTLECRVRGYMLAGMVERSGIHQFLHFTKERMLSDWPEATDSRGYHTDQIDLFKQRITQQIDIGDFEEEALTSERIIPLMLKSIEEFKRNRDTYSS